MLALHTNTIAAVGENGRVIAGTAKYHFMHRTIICDITMPGGNLRFTIPPVHREYDTFYYTALDHADNHDDKDIRHWADDFDDDAYDKLHELNEVGAMFYHAVSVLDSKGAEAIANEAALFDIITTLPTYHALLAYVEEAICDIIIEDIQRATFCMIADDVLKLREQARRSA